MRENLKEFFANTDTIHSDIALRRDLTVYLTYWLELHAAAFLVRLGLPMNRVFSAHILYSCYVHHFLGFHRLGAAQDDDPFMIRLAKGKPVSESLLSGHLRIRRFWDVKMGQSTMKFSPGLRKKAFDFGVSRDSTRAGSGRHYSLTNAKKAWLFNIRVGTMVCRRHLFVDIQLYVPSHFALQLGFSQGVVGAPSSKVKRFGGLQNGRNAWSFYSAEDTTAMIPYPELPTFRTAGFTKWFVESFSVYRGLSKKELDVKPSSRKGLGKSDGVRREEVLAFLSGEKHKIGVLDDQDVIRSGAAQEIPGEVLEQFAEEEAEVIAWIQAKRTKVSIGSTGESRPSSEDSGERPNFDGEVGTSSKSSHRSKRRRGQCRNKRRHEDSPDLEVPSTITEEASGDDDEPLEKRSRDDDLMMLEAPVDEAVTDPIMAFEEEPKDSEVDPESPLADLPEDSDDFEPSMDATFDDASDELIEAESIPPVVEEVNLTTMFRVNRGESELVHAMIDADGGEVTGHAIEGCPWDVEFGGRFERPVKESIGDYATDTVEGLEGFFEVGLQAFGGVDEGHEGGHGVKVLWGAIVFWELDDFGICFLQGIMNKGRVESAGEDGDGNSTFEEKVGHINQWDRVAHGCDRKEGLCEAFQQSKQFLRMPISMSSSSSSSSSSSCVLFLGVTELH
ncbi:hypothetical protein MRB53_028498 [Persea americana]|uniref:Uncharacterized protein n=1 Tax=Persea americana TaxID=3435 RepID=A0ACC2KFQ2_PERAE|nr:hypothetical protein MRB53_028498 [Persea americana]